MTAQGNKPFARTLFTRTLCRISAMLLIMTQMASLPAFATDGAVPHGGWISGHSFSPAEIQSSRPPAEFPLHLGRVKKIFEGTGDRLVLHIQDAHSSQEAQRHIAGLIEYFSQQYHTKLVEVEGAAGELSHHILSHYPHETSRRLTAEYFLQKGSLSGAEYFALTKNPGLQLFGIEDAALYEENRRIYLEALEYKEKNLELLKKFRAGMKKAGRTIFPPSYLKLLKLHPSSANNDRSFSDYFKELVRTASEYQLMEAYPLLQKFNALMEAEARGEKTADSRLFEVSGEAFFTELKAAEKELKEKLLQTEAQKMLDRFFTRIEIAEKIFHFSLNQEEAAYFYENRTEFTDEGWLELYQWLNQSAAGSPLSKVGLRKIAQDLSRTERFYKVALERDAALARNAVARMAHGRHKTSVLLAGGFHTPGIEKYLQEQNISYWVIEPKISGRSDFEKEGKIYEANMRGGSSKLMTLLRGPENQDTHFQLQPPRPLPTFASLNAAFTEGFFGREALDLTLQGMVMMSVHHIRLTGKSEPALAKFLATRLNRAEQKIALPVYDALHAESGFVRKSGEGNGSYLSAFSKTPAFAVRAVWRPASGKNEKSNSARSESFEVITPDRISTQFTVITDAAVYQMNFRQMSRPAPGQRSEFRSSAPAVQPVFDYQFEGVDEKTKVRILNLLKEKNRALQRKILGQQMFAPEEAVIVSIQSEISENSQIEAFRVTAGGKSFVLKLKKEAAPKKMEEVRTSDAEPSLERQAAPAESFNVFPELAAAGLMFAVSGGIGFLPLAVIGMRLLWSSALIIHGLGHVIFKWIVDKDHPLHLEEALEGITAESFLKSLVPFHEVFTPWKSNPVPVPAGDGTPWKISFKALGGPAFNIASMTVALMLLFGVTGFSGPLAFGLLAGTLVHFGFAALSLSDYVSFALGTAPFGFGCGIFWITLQRQAGETDELYTERLETLLQRLSYVMALFGSHGIGAALQIQRKNGSLDYSHFKMPSGYGQHPFIFKRAGRTALVRQFLEYFKETVLQAEKEGAKVSLVWNLSGHVRLKTSGGKLEVETTQPFYINPKMKSRRWTNENGTMTVKEELNVAYGAANGDTQKAKLPYHPQSTLYTEEEWGKFFEKVYGVHVGANDSEKAAYFMYFLTTQGMLAESLRFASMASFSKSLKDPLPSLSKLQQWEKKLEPLVQKYGTQDFSDSNVLQHVIDEAVILLPRDAAVPSANEEAYRDFLRIAFLAFQKNDMKNAARIMMSMVNEFSTFGLFFESTLFPGKKVIIAREQPASVVENLDRGTQIGGSSRDFITWTLHLDPLYKKGDRLRAFTLDMKKNQPERGGEIVYIDHYKQTFEVHNINLDRDLTPEETAARWEDITNEEPRYIPAPMHDYPMTNDMLISAELSQAIHQEWKSETPQTSKTLQGAEKFASRVIENAVSYEKIASLLQLHGIQTPVTHGAPDFFFVVFREENLAIAEWYKTLMQEAFGLANIKIVNANDYIHSIESHPLYLNTNTLFIDLGYNFPVIRTAEEHARRAAKSKGKQDPKEPFFIPDADQTEATWRVLELLHERKAPHAFVITPTQGTNISRGLDKDHVHVISSKFFPEVDGSGALMWSQMATLLELYFYTLKAVRKKFPEGAPLGMILTEKDIASLERNFEHMITKGIGEILGVKPASGGGFKKTATKTNQELMRLASELVPYFTEQARATALSFLHLLVTSVLTGSVFVIINSVIMIGMGGGPVFWASLFITGFLNVPLYQFFKYFTIRVDRWLGGREGLHRDANPTLVFGDDFWGRALRSKVSNMWALAKGIVSPSGIYYAKQFSELEGAHGKDVRRGTMIVLSGPPEMPFNDYVNSWFQGLNLIKSQAESFSSLNAVGPNMIGIVDYPHPEEFKFGHVASIHSEEREKLRAKENFDNPYRAGKIVEIAFNGPLRFMAQQMVFVEVVRQMQELSVGYDLTWDAQDNQNSIAATTQAPLRPPSPVWLSGKEFVSDAREALKPKEADPLQELPHLPVEYLFAVPEQELPELPQLPGTAAGINGNHPGNGHSGNGSNGHAANGTSKKMVRAGGTFSGKRAESRSFFAEQLEKRNLLAADMFFAAEDFSHSLGAEIAETFVSAPVQNPQIADQVFGQMALLQVEGREAVTLDSSGPVTQIDIAYTVDGVDYQASLGNFRYDSKGNPAGFSFAEVKDGQIIRRLEGKFTEFDFKNRAVLGVVEDTFTGLKIEFKFDYNGRVSDSKIGIVSEMMITAASGAVTIVLVPAQKISYVIDDSGESENPQVQAGTPAQAEDGGSSPDAPSSVSLSDESAPASEDLSGGGSDEEEDEEEEAKPGIRPEDAQKLLPDFAAPSKAPAAESSAAEAEEEKGDEEPEMSEPSADDAVLPVSLVRLNAPAPVIQGAETKEDRALEAAAPVELLTALTLTAAAVVQAATPSKKQNYLFWGTLLVLFSGAAAVAYFMAPLHAVWIVIGGAGFLIFARLLEQSLMKAQIELSRDGNVLTLSFHPVSRVQIHDETGAEVAALTFRKTEEGFVSDDGAMTAVLDPQTQQMIFAHRNENVHPFAVQNGEARPHFYSQFNTPVSPNLIRRLSVDTADQAPAARNWNFSFRFDIKPLLYTASGIGILTAMTAALYYGIEIPVPNLDFNAPDWARENRTSLIYWSLVSSAALSVLRAVRSFQKNVPPLQKGMTAAAVISAAALMSYGLLFLAPVSILAIGLGVLLGSVLTGLLIPMLLTWSWYVLSAPFRLFTAKRSFQDVTALLGIATAGGVGFYGFQAYQKPADISEERLAAVTEDFKETQWTLAAIQKETQDAKPVQAASPVEYKFQDQVPLLYDAQTEGVASVLRPHKEGNLKIHPESGLTQTEWQNPEKAFPVVGGGALLTLERPVTESNATSTQKLVDYLKQIDERYKKLYATNRISKRDELFYRAAHLLAEIENFDAQQEQNVFGTIRVPLAKGEEGWILPGQRPLGTAASDTVLAQVQSKHRLTLRAAVPAGVWQKHDLMKMKVWVSLYGKEQAVRIVRMAIEPRLDGQLLLTLGVEAEGQIFDWDLQRSRPAEVDFRLNIPLREKGTEYSSRLPQGALIRSYANLEERVSLPVHPTEASGRTELYAEEAAWVAANTPVAGISEDDKKRLREILDKSKVYSRDVNELLENYKLLREKGAISIAPPEVKKFGEDFIAIRELIAKLQFMQYSAPQAGILTGTYQSEGQAVNDQPIAQILTPQIHMRHRIEKKYAVDNGDVVIIRRPATGEETLGIVRQVNRELANQGRGEDQSRFQEIRIELNNAPSLWMADHEYGVEVLYAQDPKIQEWLRGNYAEVQKKLNSLWHVRNLTVLPPLFPVEFIAPQASEDLPLLIHLLEEPKSPAMLAQNTPVFEGVLPEIAAEQAGAPGIYPAAGREIQRILQESNGEQRRQWMKLFLQKQNIPFAELEIFALHGPADTAQMSLDYLLRQRRIGDLIAVHRSLYAKSPELDMTKLAREHVLELLETQEDPLKRLVQLDARDAKRAAAQEFLVSLISAPNAAYDPDLAIAVRKILNSDFWRTYADKLALAEALEKTPETDPRFKDRRRAAVLVRNVVFAHMVLHTGWKHGDSQAHAKETGAVERYDAYMWARLHNVEKNDAEDRRLVEHSPWIFTYTAPEENFKGRIHDELYEKAMKEYRQALETAKGGNQVLTFLNLQLQTGGFYSDHVFIHLDPLTQRDYANLLTPHAAARFLEISERPENGIYRQRWEQMVDRLVTENTQTSRMLLARLLVKTENQDLILLMMEKDVDDLLIEEARRLRGEEHADTGTVLLFAQVLAKLSSSKTHAGEGEGRLLAVRALLDFLTDFELQEAAEGKHAVNQLLLKEGVPSAVIAATAKEQVSRRAALWAIDRASVWSQVSYEWVSEVHSPAQSTLTDLQEALGIETYQPDKVKTIWKEGLHEHGQVFEKLTGFAELRRDEIEDGSKRDKVGVLETWRYRLLVLVGVLGGLLGLMINGYRKLTGQTSSRRGTSFLSRFFLWMVLPGAALSFVESPTHAASDPVQRSVSEMPRAELRKALQSKTAIRQQILLNSILSGMEIAQELNVNVPQASEGKGVLVVNYTPEFFEDAKFTESFFREWGIKRPLPHLVFYQDENAPKAEWNRFKQTLASQVAAKNVTWIDRGEAANLETYVTSLSRKLNLRMDQMVQILALGLKAEELSRETETALKGAVALSQNTVVILGSRKAIAKVSAFGSEAFLEAILRVQRAVASAA